MRSFCKFLQFTSLFTTLSILTSAVNTLASILNLISRAWINMLNNSNLSTCRKHSCFTTIKNVTTWHVSSLPIFQFVSSEKGLHALSHDIFMPLVTDGAKCFLDNANKWIIFILNIVLTLFSDVRKNISLIKTRLDC